MTTRAEPRARWKALESVQRSGERSAVTRLIAVETPIAFEFNGLGYAVMMATPSDLEDFVIGFALSERLIDAPHELLDVDVYSMPTGVIVRANLIQSRLSRVVERVRHRLSESSCGLCGIENLEEAVRPLTPISSTSLADEAAVFRALDSLRDHQPLNGETGAVHAAAWCDADGVIRTAREDVGRHNAFDKLIGAMARAGSDWDGGFALLSARCSFELVEKAVLANCPLLVTVSAPTSLAVERAAAARLPLIVLARHDALLRTERQVEASGRPRAPARQ